MMAQRGGWRSSKKRLKVKIKGPHNKSFKRTALRAAA